MKFGVHRDWAQTRVPAGVEKLQKEWAIFRGQGNSRARLHAGQGTQERRRAGYTISQLTISPTPIALRHGHGIRRARCDREERVCEIHIASVGVMKCEGACQ